MQKSTSLTLITALFVLDLVALLLTGNNFSSLMMFLVCFLSVTLITKSDKLMVLPLFLAGTAVMIFFYHYWTTYYGNSYFLGRKSDDWQYDMLWTQNFIDRYGINLNKLPNHLNNIEPGLGILHNSKGYVSLVIFLRKFASFFDGYHTLMPRVLNICILTLTSYYSSLIAYRYTNNNQIKRITLLTVFFLPVMLFNSVHVFRDTIVSFLLIWIYYVILNNKYSVATFIKVVLGLFVLYYFRTSTFFVTILMLIILYFNPKKISLRLVIIGIVFMIVAIYLFQNLTESLFLQLAAYEVLNTERFGSIGSEIFKLPLYIGFIPRIIYLIFTPVPNFSGFHQIYVSMTAFIQIFFFPFLFLGLIRKNIDFKLKLTFLLFFLGVAFSTATFRHVMMYLPFGIIITVITYNTIIRNKDFYKKYYNLLVLLFFLFITSISVAFIF